VATIAHRLELDLDAFTGPFDLLLSLILREELDLLEVELAEIVIAYIDHLEAEGELDLEAATEFLVLIAALLELKSRLMLPGGEVLDELDELAPAEAAEELLERMLQYARFRGAGGWTAHTHSAGQAYLHRSAPLPPALRRVSVEVAERAYDPAVLGQAIGSLLRTPPPLDLRHMAMPRVSVADRLAHLRALLRHRRGRLDFDEAVDGADRVTVAVTLFALLELYKRGEAAWEQDEPFGPITIQGAA
jgi:segregation and condensation protein A